MLKATFLRRNKGGLLCHSVAPCPYRKFDIVRYYTRSPDDLTLILQRRCDANLLGFAVHFAYLKFPGQNVGSADRQRGKSEPFVKGPQRLTSSTFRFHLRLGSQQGLK